MSLYKNWKLGAIYVSTRLKQNSAYADGVIIIGRTKQVMIETFTKLKK
jgi:hypothetical protein